MEGWLEHLLDFAEMTWLAKTGYITANVVQCDTSMQEAAEDGQVAGASPVLCS